MRGAHVVQPRLPPATFSKTASSKDPASSSASSNTSEGGCHAGETSVNNYVNPFPFELDLDMEAHMRVPDSQRQDVSDEFRNPTKRRKVARTASSMSPSPSPFLNPAAFLPPNLHFPMETATGAEEDPEGVKDPFVADPAVFSSRTNEQESLYTPPASPTPGRSLSQKAIPLHIKRHNSSTTPPRLPDLVNCDDELEETYVDDLTDQFSDQFSQITISDDEGPMDAAFSFNSPFLATGSALNGYHDEHFVNNAANPTTPLIEARNSLHSNSPSPKPGKSLTVTRPVHIPKTLAGGAAPSSMLRNFSPLSLDLPKCQSPDYLKSIPTPPPSPSYRGFASRPELRDWTKEYQRASEIKNKAKRAEAIEEITQSFCSEAKRIGKIIVEERSLAPSRRSIKTLSGGVGGGEKYIHNSIFFKLAVDNNDLYGGDEHSMKVAGHEMKGVVSYSSIEQDPSKEQVQFGMTILIDYRGFRMIASSILPISPDTLVYGSCDGGHTVKGEEESPYGKAVGRLASQLNLRSHLAGLGDDPKVVVGPCDQEGHLGTDGKLYVVDLARLYPPETPDINKKGSFLYRLLRPEFVAKYEKPLSSDAFSLFGKNGDYEEINNDARKATDYLRDRVIPDLAFHLSRQAVERWGQDVDFSQFTTDHLEQLTSDLHNAGVNLRYLGRIYLQSTDSRVQRLALTEMVARVLKHTLRAKLREPSTLGAFPNYEEIAINFFNNIFGKGFESEIMWSVDIPMDLESNFSFAVTFGIREHIDLDLLCARIQSLCGVKMRSSGVPSQKPRPFSRGDLEGFCIREKFTHPEQRHGEKRSNDARGKRRERKGSAIRMEMTASVPEWHCLFQQESYM